MIYTIYLIYNYTINSIEYSFNIHIYMCVCMYICIIDDIFRYPKSGFVFLDNYVYDTYNFEY